MSQLHKPEDLKPDLKPYAKPLLTTYGSLQNITEGGMSSSHDAGGTGNNSTKA